MDSSWRADRYFDRTVSDRSSGLESKFTPPSVPQELTGAEDSLSRCQRNEMRRDEEIQVVYVNEGWEGIGKWMDRRVGIAQ